MKSSVIPDSGNQVHKVKCSLCHLLFLLLAVIVTPPVSLSQNFNWITPNKTYLKLSVVDDGMYRITRSDFTNAGINTSSVDPRTVKLFNKGAQIPIYFEGESDGTFDSPDYFDFYGQRNYGGMTKTYTVDNTPYYQKDEYYSFYSDTNVYWIDWGGDNGLRYSNYGDTTSTPFSSSVFTERFHFEKDKVYSQGERANATDYRYFNNELFQGEGWYWVNMYNGYYLTENFSTPNLPDTAMNCSLNFFAYPSDINTSVFNEHRIRVLVNNNVVADVYKNDFTRFNTTVTFSTSILRADTVNVIAVLYTVAGYDGHTNLDYVDIQVPSKFRFRSSKVSANLSGTDTSARLFRLSGFQDAPLYLYDVKNYNRLTNYSTSFDTLTLTARNNAKLEILNSSVLKKPFRITQRQVPDLVSSVTGADYVLVYHSLFESQATQLASYRASHDGFRVFKAKVSDIYDVFNYGIEDPSAVRLFCKNIYDTWPGNRFSYLCLFGRGTFDPKKNSLTTVYDKNYVPVYGYPNTDSYFANYSIGAFAYLDKVAVGRLPVYTTAEAQAMVDNIIAYESRSPEAWMKNDLFVVGGGTSEEQLFNQSLVTPLMNNYVIPPPFSGNVHKAFRVDTTTAVTYNYKDSVRRDINNGVLIANFQGHAGYQNWEDAMQEPSTLENYGKFPFVLSMTCYTGKTADNTARIFGEKFVTMSNKGSVGFLGTTGWGFVYSGSEFHDKIYYGMMHDTLRRLGDIIKYGKERISYDTVGSVTRHTLNCYGLLGDPALKLSLPEWPEFHISSDGYRLSDNFPSVSQTVTLTVFPFNYGLHSDSCKIGFTLYSDNAAIQGYDTVLRAFKFSDSVRYSFRLDSVRNYSVRVELDKDNWADDENEDNNILNVDIPLKNNSFVQFRPVDMEAVAGDTVELAGLNPLNRETSVKVLLQIDTSQAFNSPLLMTFAVDSAAGPVTEFNAAVPIVDTNVVYFWRTNSVKAGDSTGWTGAWSFTVSPPAAVNVSGNRNMEVISDSYPPEVSLRKFSKKQFPVEDLYNTTLSDTGIGLTRYPLNLYVRSMGSSGAEISHFFVNDKAINIDGGRSTGLNMAKVKKLNGQIIEHKCFKLFNSGSMDSVTNFLNTFDSSYYLMALNASYVDYSLVQPLTETVKAKIRSFGSTKIDSMFKFGYFDTWSFIGYLGAGPGYVSEQYYKYTSSAGWRDAQSSVSTTYLKTSGTISNVIGPAESWQNFSWAQEIVPNSTVSFDVYGITQAGSKTLILSGLTANGGVDLSSVNALQYPFLDLVCNIRIDTVSGSSSSLLERINAVHTLPAEIIALKEDIAVSDSLAEVGKEMKVYFNLTNAGYQDVHGFALNFYRGSVSQSNLFFTDTAHVAVRVDSIARVMSKFIVPYFRARGDGRIPIVIDAVPVGGKTEFHTYNNSVMIEPLLQLPGGSRSIAVYSDGVLLRGGEKISSRPEIRVEFAGYDKNTFDRSRTGKFALRINGELLLNVAKSQTADKSRNSEFTGNAGTTADPDRFYPVFRNGSNKLTVIYESAEGISDSASYDVIVSSELALGDVYNFPNPMKDRTSFMFELSGLNETAEAVIRIYTSGGRMIRELRAPAVTGINAVEWDGRDGDGDLIANGTYIYKVRLDGLDEAGSVVQKLVMLK